ncbi:carboxylesterase/lipase family protein [Mycolicibacterium chlorophenolicum]|uniref:carboxylesterase/lipase family protein n=1 Tax=Mycolicibacterium chlorophenolicum TaxID=37916 RepID=UPI00065455EF|nr:carboxylesterase/lipase family protein [Mycolicibacterium chlorophenolicum]
MTPATVLRRVLCVLFAVVLVAGCAGGRGEAPPPAPADPALAQITTGTLRGVVAQDHRLFAGIPYAAPPVGPLRFADPQPAAPWPGVRDATTFGPRCMQSLGGDIELGRQTDEDCLSLNVWTPAAASAKPRPVMVWIHGGAFVNGSGKIYDARRLAARGDIVVVTINYRLGALGFLAHPALGAPGHVGNYGLADQQAALRWVRDNISAFGGDPDRVTVAGESAGGMSVCDHLVAPGSRGLFAAAIIQSGPCQAQAALPVAQDRSLQYAAGRGCADPAQAARCLRALPADKLREPAWFYNIGDDELTGPVTGTAALPRDPMSTIGSAGAQQVPVLMGTTRDEFTLFVGMQYVREGVRYTPQDYPRLLADAFGHNAPAVAQRYPLAAYPSVPLAYSAAVTDGVFSCIGDRLARALTGGPVYFYEFNDRAAPAPEPLRTLPFPVGASHSLELRYLFDVGGALPLDPAQQKLSDEMIDYWSSFVKSASPDTDGRPQWDAFGDGNQVMSLQPDGSRMIDSFADEHQCAFWAGLR